VFLPGVLEPKGLRGRYASEPEKKRIMATEIVTLPPLARLSKIEQFPRSLLGYAFRVQITIKLVADVLEVRCAHCQRLLDIHSNRRDAYFPAADFLDHVCAAPVHQAAFQERINPQIQR
jgi:hypothetical protein